MQLSNKAVCFISLEREPAPENDQLVSITEYKGLVLSMGGKINVNYSSLNSSELAVKWDNGLKDVVWSTSLIKFKIVFCNYVQSLVILPLAKQTPTANLWLQFQVPRKCPWHRGETRRGSSIPGALD